MLRLENLCVCHKRREERILLHVIIIMTASPTQLRHTIVGLSQPHYAALGNDVRERLPQLYNDCFSRKSEWLTEMAQRCNLFFMSNPHAILSSPLCSRVMCRDMRRSRQRATRDFISSRSNSQFVSWSNSSLESHM